MTIPQHLDLIRQMEWADALIWRALLNVPSLEFKESLTERLHHFHSIQCAYGQILRGVPVNIPALSAFSNWRSLGLWAKRFYTDTSAYFADLNEVDLSVRVEFPWAAQLAKRFGNVGPATVGDSIIQLAQHSSYHRGQVALRLREAGGEPPLTDFIAWVWLERPAPDWAFLEAA